VTNILDQVLVCSNNPIVSKVRVGVSEQLILKSRVEDESLARATLPSSDILNKEAVGVEPGQEDISDDTTDAFLLELKRFSTHYRRVTQVKTACVSSIVIGNEGWVRVVLFRF
jgi:hypothetical protein